MPRTARVAAVPQKGLTKHEALCVEALAYLAPGGWSSFHRLYLTGRVPERVLETLAAPERRVVECRLSVISDGRGHRVPGEGRRWRLTPEGWALARAQGWGWDDEDEDEEIGA